MTEPPVGSSRPRIIRMVVLSPAPSGPRKPVTTPGRTVNVRSETAVVGPYVLVSARSSIMDMTVPAAARRVAGAPSRPWVGISAPGAQDSPIVTSRMSLYVDVMTSADLTLRWVRAMVSSLRSASAWRATSNGLAALFAAAVGTALLGGLARIWGAAGLARGKRAVGHGS